MTSPHHYVIEQTNTSQQLPRPIPVFKGNLEQYAQSHHETHHIAWPATSSAPLHSTWHLEPTSRAYFTTLITARDQTTIYAYKKCDIQGRTILNHTNDLVYFKADALLQWVTHNDKHINRHIRNVPECYTELLWGVELYLTNNKQTQPFVFWPHRCLYQPQ